MPESRYRSFWLETVGLALAAVLLYQSALLLLVSFVPLVILLRRRGESWYAVGALITIVGIGLLRLIQLSRAQIPLTGGLLLVDVAVPAVLLAGTYALGAEKLRGYRGVYKLGMATAAFGLLSLAAVIPAVQSGALQSFMEEQFGLVLRLLGQGEAASPAVVEQTAAIARESLLAAYVMMFGFILGLNWYIGSNLTARFGGEEAAVRLRRFRLPAWFVWLLIGAGAAILLDVTAGLGALRYVAWNLGLFTLMLFGAQGLGLLWYLFDRNRLGQGGRIMAGLTLIVLLFVPGFNLLVLLGLPGFGISEIWVRYGRAPQ